MFFYSLDVSHSEEQTASGVDSVNDESTDECWDSESAVSGSDTDSEYVPTPERPVTLKVSRTDLPNEVAFMEVYQSLEWARDGEQSIPRGPSSTVTHSE